MTRKKSLFFLLIIVALVMRPGLAYAHLRDIQTVISISAVGDCTLGHDEREQYVNSFAYYYERNSPSYFFSNVVDLFAKDDLTIANCEGVLADPDIGEPAEKTYIHRGNSAYADIFKRGHVEAVSLANNHTLDFFKEGFDETRANLSAYGVGYFGRGYVLTKTVRGIKIALLGYSGYDTGYKQIAQRDIEKQRENGTDLIIVSFHWGDDKAHYPNDIQFELGRFAIDSGADLVLGHHPHVIQGLELYKGKYIVYSLGNFCYGGSKNPADKDTFIFRQQFTFFKGKPFEAQAEVIPARISSTTARNDYRPTPLYGKDAERVFKRLTEYSLPFSTEIPRSQNIKTLSSTGLDHIILIE